MAENETPKRPQEAINAEIAAKEEEKTRLRQRVARTAGELQAAKDVVVANRAHREAGEKKDAATLALAEKTAAANQAAVANAVAAIDEQIAKLQAEETA